MSSTVYKLYELTNNKLMNIINKIHLLKANKWYITIYFNILQL